MMIMPGYAFGHWLQQSGVHVALKASLRHMDKSENGRSSLRCAALLMIFNWHVHTYLVNVYRIYHHALRNPAVPRCISLHMTLIKSLRVAVLWRQPQGMESDSSFEISVIITAIDIMSIVCGRITSHVGKDIRIDCGPAVQ